MSRVGRLPISLPKEVQVQVEGHRVVVKGPKGELQRDFDSRMMISLQDEQLTVARTNEDRTQRALHGLTRAIIANMVQGVQQGFEKGLEIHGVGYSVKLQGRGLLLELGFSHPIDYPLPDGIDAEVRTPTNPAVFILRGCDKQLVGQVAAAIRDLRPVEPYKGKGVRYMGEQIRRKAGKTFTSAG